MYVYNHTHTHIHIVHTQLTVTVTVTCTDTVPVSLSTLSTFSTFPMRPTFPAFSVRSIVAYCRVLALRLLSSIQVDLSDNRLSPSTIGRVLLALRESGQGKGLLTLNLSSNVLGVEGARALVTLCEDGSAPELKELRLDHMDIRDQVSVGRRERREREETQTELWSLPTAYSSDRTSHVKNNCFVSLSL
jgi:hypothetical protein